MNVLFELIGKLDGYTLGHVQQKLEADKSKAFKLFQLYKTYKNRLEPPDDEIIMKKLYAGKSDMGALYRLKNRLVNNINQALVELHTSEGKQSFLSEQNLILYRIFQVKGMENLAEYYLQKSIKYAEAAEQYSMLDILYGEMISYCKDTLKQDPDIYIQKRRKNFKMFNNLRNIDEILAVMTYRLKSTQNLGGQLNVSKEIDKTLKYFASDEEVFKSNQFKIKFYKAVSQILVQQQKFSELQAFILITREDFITAGTFNKQTHNIKIEQLVYLINSLLFQRKYDMVIDYGKLLYTELLEYDKLLFDKYIYFYYQALINSYSVLDMNKGIELQQEILNKGSAIIKDPYFIVFNYANLASLFFLQKNYKEAARTLQKVYLNKYFERTDLNLKVELAVMELIARYELSDANTFEYRLAQVENDFANEWKDYDGLEKILYEIVKKINVEPNFRKNKELLKLANAYLKKNEKNVGRVFNFDGWVKEKFAI